MLLDSNLKESEGQDKRVVMLFCQLGKKYFGVLLQVGYSSYFTI